MHTTMSSVTPWSSTVQYGVVPYNAIPANPAISGMINIHSLVSYNNVLYLCNKGVIPTINVAPPLQPDAWTQIGGGTVSQSSSGFIANFTSTSDLTNGVVTFPEGIIQTEPSGDIIVNRTTGIISLPQKKMKIRCILHVNTNSNGTGYFGFMGTNCELDVNIMQATANGYNQVLNCIFSSTPTAPNSSIKLVATGITGSVRFNPLGGSTIEFESFP